VVIATKFGFKINPGYVPDQLDGILLSERTGISRPMQPEAEAETSR
jgi:hypothetical protein